MDEKKTDVNDEVFPEEVVEGIDIYEGVPEFDESPWQQKPPTTMDGETQ